MDPINIQLLMNDSNGAYVRVIDEVSIFAYGTNWSLLIHKGFDSNLIKLLLENQTSATTVFHIGVLSTNINNVMMGMQNNSFKPNGSMTSQTLKYSDEAWSIFYDEALEQVNYTTRPGPYVLLNNLVLQGQSKAHYSKDKKDSRRFAETGVPVPERVDYIIDETLDNTPPKVFSINGSIERFAQNMGIELSIPSFADLRIDITQASQVVPWVVGRSEQSWMLVKPLTNVHTDFTRRNLHTNELVACWGDVDFACALLHRSKAIFRNLDVISALHNTDVLCEEDHRVEIKNLGIRNYFSEFSPELFAIDILRYLGWSNSDIQAMLATTYESAWLVQCREIMEVFDGAYIHNAPEAQAYLDENGHEDIAFMQMAHQMTAGSTSENGWSVHNEINSMLLHLERYAPVGEIAPSISNVAFHGG